MRKPWTEEEIKIIEDNYLTMSDKELMSLIADRTEAAITTKRKKMGKTKTNKKYNIDIVKRDFERKDYILLSEEFIDCVHNLDYICKKHKDKGVQKLSYGHMLEGKGCKYCGVIKQGLKRRTVTDDQCKQVCEEKNFKYIRNEIENQCRVIFYICNNHPEVGIQKMRLGNMRRKFIKGCPFCKKKLTHYSKGERAIQDLLNKNKIKYIDQYIFKDCCDKKPLPFDFYLPDHNIIIEFDGEHHYFPVNFNGITDEHAKLSYEQTKKHDKIKNYYCEDNGIDIIRIPYWELNNLYAFLIRKFTKYAITLNNI